MKKLLRPRRREKKARSLSEALSKLFEAPEIQERLALAALKSNWRGAMGDFLGDISRPAGNKGDVLFIGAEDNMAMQELCLRTPEILERANAAMGYAHFRRVKVQLLLGSPPVSRPARARSALLAPPVPPPPPFLGRLRGRMDCESPVASCYEAYLALYGLA